MTYYTCLKVEQVFEFLLLLTVHSSLYFPKVFWHSFVFRAGFWLTFILPGPGLVYV